MSANPNHGGLWTDAIWQQIDDSVKNTAMGIRVAQQVFSTTQLTDVTSIPADIFNPEHMRITEGITKPYIEISVEFPLTNGQVNGDTAGQTALTLATLASKSMALAEDLIFFQGDGVHLPPAVRIESGRESAGRGLVGLVPPNHVIAIPPADRHRPTNSGEGILAAVAQGISLLTFDLQAPDFKLILDTNAYAATWGSVVNGVPTYTVLGQVLTGGIYGTGAMPPNTGLLVATGGNPTTIYYSDDPMTEETFRDRDGKFYFRVFERVNIVAKDPRCFVRLDFPHLGSQELPAERSSQA
jgi:hypothetical protein